MTHVKDEGKRISKSNTKYQFVKNIINIVYCTYNKGTNYGKY